MEQARTGAERAAAARRSGRHLTLHEVARLSREGAFDGWYVAPSGTRWMVGRKSGGDDCVIVVGAQPMTFDSQRVAIKYLRALLLPTGVDIRSSLARRFDIALGESAAPPV